MAYQEVSDEHLRKEIRARLLSERKLDPSKMLVVVRGGTVTLDGSVETRLERRVAGELVKGVEGVAAVHNRLVVRLGFLGELAKRVLYQVMSSSKAHYFLTRAPRSLPRTAASPSSRPRERYSFARARARIPRRRAGGSVQRSARLGALRAARRVGSS